MDPYFTFVFPNIGEKNIALQKLTTKQGMEQTKDEIPPNSGRSKRNVSTKIFVKDSIKTIRIK